MIFFPISEVLQRSGEIGVQWWAAVVLPSEAAGGVSVGVGARWRIIIIFRADMNSTHGRE